MKPLFIIYTPYGVTYEVNGLGEIRTKNSGSFSSTWKVQGLESVKSNFYIPFKSMTKERIESLQMLYKNGNPRFTIRDLDHGTTRVWGNTKYHGVKRIEFL